MKTDDVAVEDQEPETPTADQIFIVGIGASAGGLEAIRALLKNLPENAPAAYIIAQHLSPTHKSLLTQLIGRETTLKVVELSGDVAPQINTIYVTPPRNDVLYEHGLLRLVPPSIEMAVPKPSVDRLMISMAEHAGNRAVGIILSGTGTDGAHGVQAIRGGDGLTFVQSEKSAKYNGMPVAAVETGSVDVIGSPEEIGGYMAHLSAKRGALAVIQKEVEDDEPVREVLRLVLMRTRVDFRDYKQATIHRRIERRMSGLNIETAEKYAAFCKQNPEEVDLLFRDLLISVTRFFRDPAEFDVLKETLTAKTDIRKDAPFRVWVPGCATGEEAYSIAMIMVDLMGGLHEATRRRLQVFATDIDERALSVARAGRYSLGSISDVPRHYVERYVTLDADGGSISPELKRLVIFSAHNVFDDPPFVEMDLISCRNLLIYFVQSLQEKTLLNFHYAMRPDGVLFLGTADHTTTSGDLFTRHSKEANIMRRRPVDRMVYRGRSSTVPMPPARASMVSRVDRDRESRPESQVNPLVKAMVRSISPDGVLLTEELAIVSIFGNLNRYVSLKENQFPQLDHSVFVGSLSQELRILTTMAAKDNTAKKSFVRDLEDTDGHSVRVEVNPLVHPDLSERMFLASFVSVESEDPADAVKTGADVSTTDQVKALEKELRSTREALSLSIEQWEAANEELKSTNEELQSNNEELRSMNEELETSNEELQSTNEELITVNEALQVVTNELTAITEEQYAILGEIHTPLLILDRNLRVLKISRTASDLFGGRLSTGNPHISQVPLPDGFPSLVQICETVIGNGEAVVRRFEANGARHTVRCSPYTNAQGQLRGATLLFIIHDTDM